MCGLRVSTFLPHYHLTIDYGLATYGSKWPTFANDHLLVSMVNYDL